MSTGDQSQYIRSKLAERGYSATPVKFMKDGFDRWAESTAPSRVGQMDKVPAEAVVSSSGGAMTVSQAKRIHKLIGSEAKQMLTKLGHFYGGANRTIWGIELSDQMNQAADWAVYFSQGYLDIKDVLDKFLADLDRQIIKNTDYTGPDADKDDKALLEFSKTLKAYFEKWKSLFNVLGAIAKFVKDNLGKPPPPPDDKAGKGYHGGAGTWEETWKNFTAYVEKNFNAIKDLAMWFYEHRVETYALLRTLDSLQPKGKIIADVLETIFGKPPPPKKDTPAGSGRLTLQFFVRMNKKHSGRSNKMSGGKKCMCRGSAFPFDSFMGRRPAMEFVPDSSGDFIPMPAPGTKPGEFVPDPYDGPGDFIPMPRPGVRPGRRPAPGLTPVTGSFMPIPSAQPFDSNEGGRRKVGGKKGSASFAQQIGAQAGLTPVTGSFMPIPSAQPFDSNEGGRSCGGKKPSARGAIVKKVMREKGLSLPQASKYVKEHGLY